jgi:hypothetical protein
MPSCFAASASQTNLAITRHQLKDCLISSIDFVILFAQPPDPPERGAAAFACSRGVETVASAAVQCWIQRSRIRGLLSSGGPQPARVEPSGE